MEKLTTDIWINIVRYLDDEDYYVKDYEQRLRLPPDILANAFSFEKLEKWYKSVSFSLEKDDLEHLYHISTHPVVSPFVKELKVCTGGTERPLPITMKQLLQFKWDEDHAKCRKTTEPPTLEDLTKENYFDHFKRVHGDDCCSLDPVDFDAIYRSLTDIANAHRIFEESAEDVNILSRCMDKLPNLETIQIDNFYRYRQFNWEVWEKAYERDPDKKSTTHLLSVVIRSLATSSTRNLMVEVRGSPSDYWWGSSVAPAAPLSLSSLMSLDNVRGGQLSLTTLENALSRLRKLELKGIYYDIGEKFEYDYEYDDEEYDYENEEDKSRGSDLQMLQGSNQALRCILLAAKGLEELTLEFTSHEDHRGPLIPLSFLIEEITLPLLRKLKLHTFVTRRQWLHDFLMACPSVELLELKSVTLLHNDWVKVFINLKDALPSIAEFRFSDLSPNSSLANDAELKISDLAPKRRQ
ncbi:MAG: hypothetical protein LQ351_007564 [Letrouitia transgressa]|nr:MAG: hypothetical protein LQ351_007564 [Letrouitia transgressa]